MWRVVVRQLTRFDRLQSKQKSRVCSRKFSSSFVAPTTGQTTAFCNSELVGVEAAGSELSISSALPFGTPAAIQYREPNPLEDSVTALDAALHSAAHLPWLANSMWWMDWLSDSRNAALENYFSSRSIALPTFGREPTFGGKPFTSAAAVEVVEEEKAPVYDEDVVEREQKQRNNQARRHQSRMYARQVKIESEAWSAAAAEYRELLLEMCKKNLAPNLPFVQSLLLGWFEPFKEAIVTEQQAIKNLDFREHRAGYGPYLTQLPADMLAVITMHKLMGMLMTDLATGGCVKVVTAASQIGDAVETEVAIHKLMGKKGKKKSKKKDSSTDVATVLQDKPSDAVGKLQGKVMRLVKKQRLRLAGDLVRHANGDEPWNGGIKVKVGSVLIELLLHTAFVRSPASQTVEDNGELRPAFKHSIKAFKTFPGEGAVGHHYGVIECDPLIIQQLDKSVRYMAMPYMPMLVQPRHWKGFSKGGYLILPSTIMRCHGARQLRQAIEKASPTSMKEVFKALDTLGSVQWRINSAVLDVVEKIWADGGRLAGMVDAEDIPIPTKPVGGDELELKIWKREAAKAKRINSERHCLRCDTELKLKVARSLRNEEIFYYPHNVDFRGRAYPLHPHLNHLGSDLCRGVLEFGVGRELGPRGLKWLKVHLANVFAAGGVDKFSFDGRVAFVDENLDDVFDSAKNPLEGRRWWLEAEDPFQCLAACKNIREALLSDNVETFVSHLPVHQDGSCNGLQHYAALGRDQIGAESVNLTQGEKPADVYSGIAVRVRAVIEKDAGDNPNTNANVQKAILLLNQIDRKLVKQTVMTSVYGVTFIGARNQILCRLQERNLGDDVDLFRAACYAAKITIDALGEMFKEARCIMNWLGDCAKLIACEGEPVMWTTPLGLPVVQPYRKPGRLMVKTSLQCLALKVDGNQPVAVSRQRSAFPPNFVHSLDGSHMMMTALACRRSSIHFAGVHDSFWTHAGTIETLNTLLRKTFVELYGEPILENLLTGFKAQFPELEFPDVPKRGDFDLSEVTKAAYFFN